ncbi:MAG: DUF2088 domain-containing protein [Eubacterium sp.]|nr:DUF2088 domain-containing protein [Eubacterium sp.]MBQ6363415.1 DUF2088 domain-containing protein [Lachnospiraceae bacterium]
MRFIDFPEIHFFVQGIDDVVLPRMVRIREQYEKDKIEDIRAHLNAKLDLTVQDKSWYKGKSIAITVGSRGIPDLPLLVRTICDRLKSWGAEPFIVPAMGSHGGGCVEGNLEILTGYGITEESTGVPIRAGMEVVRIGELPDDARTPVYCDRFAAEADGIVLFNKVKPHTDFKGYHESGLCKMMAIGLAKHKGASWFHMQGFETFAERIPLVADVFLKNTNVVFGVGVVQNAYDDISEIEVFPTDQIREGDHRLLEIARRRLPKMKFDNIDVLIIDRIGKEISGEGADPNVTGRGFMPYFEDDFHCKKLFIRGISELSHHNGCGLGLADITTRRCLNQVDWESTWINLSTSLMIQGGKIPMYQNNDYDALRLALRTCPRLNDYSGARIARIKNTLSLGEIEVSEPIYEEIRNRSDIEAVGDPYELSFDENGNLEDLP